MCAAHGYHTQYLSTGGESEKRLINLRATRSFNSKQTNLNYSIVCFTLCALFFSLTEKKTHKVGKVLEKEIKGTSSINVTQILNVMHVI